MSYSFNVRGGSKDEAREQASAKLAEVTEQQPIHAHDQALAEQTVAGVLDLVGDVPEGHELSLSVSGSCWHTDGVFGGVNLSVNVSHLRSTAA